MTILLLFPEMEVAKISLLTKFKPTQIKKFKETVATKKSQAVKTFINEKFLAKISLTKEEQKEIDLLTKKLLASMKK